jgi:hypothetical protein
MSYLVARTLYKFHMSITSDSLVKSNNLNMIMLSMNASLDIKICQQPANSTLAILAIA